MVVVASRPSSPAREMGDEGARCGVVNAAEGDDKLRRLWALAVRWYRHSRTLADSWRSGTWSVLRVSLQGMSRRR